MEMGVEVYREDVDNLTQALLAVVGESVGGMLHVDRSIIVAAALANVAYTLDAVEEGICKPECTTRLKQIIDRWKANG